MHFEGTFLTRAPPERVYAFLLDPEKLSACVDDPHTIEVQDADHFKGTVKAGIGFIKGTFGVVAAIVERTPPTHARLKVRGSGMGSGFDINADLDVAGAGGSTTVRWAAEVQMNGSIASVGARLMQGTVDKKTKAFFENVRKQLGEP